MSLKVMFKNFLMTRQGKQIIILEDQGYKLCQNQMDLTYPQELFLMLGKEWLAKEKEKEIKKHQR